MRWLTATLLSCALAAPVFAQERQGGARSSSRPLTADEVRAVSPALDKYIQGDVLAGLWQRPELSRRDRSIVTLSVLIARNQTIEMPFHVRLALDNGVTPREISEIVTHLAFYSGLGNAHAAIAVVKEIFAERGIGIDQIPPASPKLLPLDRAAEDRRA